MISLWNAQNVSDSPGFYPRAICPLPRMAVAFRVIGDRTALQMRCVRMALNVSIWQHLSGLVKPRLQGSRTGRGAGEIPWMEGATLFSWERIE